MAAEIQSKHVSKLVSADLRLFMPLLSAATIVNSATLGYDSYVMDGLLILPSYSEYFHPTTTTGGFKNANMWTRGVSGAIVLQPVPYYFDRRRPIYITSIVSIVGIVLQASAQNIALFVTARIIVDIGSAVSNGAVPTLLGELLPPCNRTRILGLIFPCFHVGILASANVNYSSQDIDSTGSQSPPSLLQINPSLLSAPVVPSIAESPRWLFSRERDDEALEMLLVMQGEDKLDLQAGRRQIKRYSRQH